MSILHGTASYKLLFSAFIGTTLSTFCIAGCAFIALQLSRLADLAPQEMKFNHCLQFGAMISATDPVTVLSIFKGKVLNIYFPWNIMVLEKSFLDLKVEPNLDAMLFGESVINDAVAIVLSEVRILSLDLYILTIT